MSTKIKTLHPVKPPAPLLAKAPLLHDVTNPSPSRIAAMRRRFSPTPLTAGSSGSTTSPTRFPPL